MTRRFYIIEKKKRKVTHKFTVFVSVISLFLELVDELPGLIPLSDAESQINKFKTLTNYTI